MREQVMLTADNRTYLFKCSIKFSMYGQGGLKLEINTPPQQTVAKWKGGGGLIIEGGLISSEDSILIPERKNIAMVQGIFRDLNTLGNPQQC